MQNTEEGVKLMTLLNVSAALPRNTKRARDPLHDWAAIAKKARKTAAKSAQQPQPASEGAQQDNKKKATVISSTSESKPDAHGEEQSLAAGSEESGEDAYKHHFGPETPLLRPSTLSAIEQWHWTSKPAQESSLGSLTELSLALPEGLDSEREAAKLALVQNMNPRLLDKFDQWLKAQSVPTGQTLSRDLLDYLSSYRDLLFSRVQLPVHESMRAAVAVHAMNHITKTRNRVLRNNEHLAQAEKEPSLADDARETRDQGFTRPKVLILLPFRNSALSWLDHLTHLSLASNVENRQRFVDEFSLPPGTTDKLAAPDAPSRYPADHIATFQGNIDDSFRVGLKLTRTTLKCFAEFYQADIILASPLGLRMSIEKQKKGAEGGAADFLSSIELLVVDQTDVLTMQNWEHVQFVMKYLNQLPKEAHDADFARIKPWYLDGHAANLRQSVVLSAYDTPEIRAMFSKQLSNVAGKARTEAQAPGVLTHIPRGVRQVFQRFNAGSSAVAENEARFDYFKNKTLPDLQKSAVASAGNTLIFVPSYFDYLRVSDYMDQLDIDFDGISEYSSNSDISRARNAFLAGKLPILLLTERFYFFKRYRIRGAKTIIFYSLPDHAQFYQEVMNQPFQQVPGNKYELPDTSEVSSHVIFSKLDALKLERTVGTSSASSMLTAEETRFTFS